VFLVSVGVSIASISTTSAAITSLHDVSTTYLYGILMLTTSLLATAILGILQERTYRTYGSCWREGVFYTVRHPNVVSPVLRLRWNPASPLPTHIYIPSQRRDSGLQKPLNRPKRIHNLSTIYISGHEPTDASRLRLGRQQTHIGAWQTRSRSTQPLPKIAKSHRRLLPFPRVWSSR